MAARVRSDRRIARAGAVSRADVAARVGRDRCTLPTKRKSGRVDLHLKSARKGHITVALTGRGRRQHHRLRGMSTRIRALVHEQAVDASTVTLSGDRHKGAPGRQRYVAEGALLAGARAPCRKMRRPLYLATASARLGERRPPAREVRARTLDERAARAPPRARRRRARRRHRRRDRARQRVEVVAALEHDPERRAELVARARASSPPSRHRSPRSAGTTRADRRGARRSRPTRSAGCGPYARAIGTTTCCTSDEPLVVARAAAAPEG